MDLSFMTGYVNLLTLGICLCVGYALKTAFQKFPNKFIPLAALILGCIINILTNLKTGITPQIIFSGMISGLSSTGCYELFKNFLNKEVKTETTDE